MPGCCSNSFLRLSVDTASQPVHAHAENAPPCTVWQTLADAGLTARRKEVHVAVAIISHRLPCCEEQDLGELLLRGARLFSLARPASTRLSGCCWRGRSNDESSGSESGDADDCEAADPSSPAGKAAGRASSDGMDAEVRRIRVKCYVFFVFAATWAHVLMRPDDTDALVLFLCDDRVRELA